MDRETAWQIVNEFVQDAGLRRHMLCVEAAMQWYAGKLGGEPQTWAITGLLHDYDWEIHPTLEAHPQEGIALLRERGCGDEVAHAILSHNEVATAVAREHPMDFALLACDEITGLLVASALVRPSKDIREMKVKSVKKKWKDKAFAAGVKRDEVEQATTDFSNACFDGKLELWDHVANVLEAMQGAAEALELDGRLAS